MRVIAGTLASRQFNSPQKARTRPMSEKMRGALYSALGDITGLKLADAYSGSGALAFEALSRGAASVTVVESSAKALAVIKQNAASLGLSSPSLTLKAMSVEKWLLLAENLFDVVLADPPYDDIKLNVLAHIPEKVISGGLSVLSFPGEAANPELQESELIKIKSFGDAKLLFYRKI